MYKTCYKCKETKPVDKFYKKSSNKTDMLSGRCKKCDNLLKTTWRKNNPKKVKAYERYRWRTSDKKDKDLKRALKDRLEMSDSYIRELMTKKYKDLSPHDISDDFLTIYRDNLKLKRQLGLTAKLKDLKKQPT